jgi:hypothetical protein
LVETVELFLQHLEESALQIKQSRETDKGYETVLATTELLDVSKRYALVPIESADSR